MAVIEPRHAAIIGMGGFAHLHHQALSVLEEKGVARLVATCDPNLDAFPEPKALGARVYRDYHEMLDAHAAELDWVCIPTPLPFHAPMHRACVERGLAVYLEKPPTLDPTELEAMIAAEEGARFASQVGFNFIGEPERLNLKARLLNGEFGALRRAGFTGHWPRPKSYFTRGAWVGKLRANGCWVLDSVVGNALAHYVHNLLFWCGSGDLSSWGEVEEVEAELYRAHVIESFDTVFARGICGSVEIRIAATHAGSGTSWQHEWLECERATISYWTRGGGWKICWHDGQRESGSTEALSTGEILTRNLRHYVQYLNGHSSRPLTTLTDSRPFVHLNGLLFVAARHIASISTDFVGAAINVRGEEFWAIENIESHLQDFAVRGHLPSEKALAWARAGGRAVADDLNRLEETLSGLLAEEPYAT